MGWFDDQINQATGGALDNYRRGATNAGFDINKWTNGNLKGPDLSTIGDFFSSAGSNIRGAGGEFSRFGSRFGENIDANFGTKDRFYNTPIGQAIRGADEIIGEVFGRNLARQADYEQKVRMEEEARLRQQMDLDKRRQDEIMDRMASDAAEVSRRSSSRGRSPLSYTEAVQTNKDFLGL